MGCCSAVARIIQRSLSPERNSARSRQHDTSPNTTLRAIHPYLLYLLQAHNMHLHAGNPPGPGSSTVLRTLPSDQIDPLKQRARPLVTRRCQSQVRALHHPVWRISPKRSKSPALYPSHALLYCARRGYLLQLLNSAPVPSPHRPCDNPLRACWILVLVQGRAPHPPLLPQSQTQTQSINGCIEHLVVQILAALWFLWFWFCPKQLATCGALCLYS